MSNMWLTPEEAEQKKKRKNQMIVIAIPVITILAGAAITLLSHNL
ncbi:hypothetical protein ACQCVE_05895 [Metabacillus sp. 113a]